MENSTSDFNRFNGAAQDLKGKAQNIQDNLEQTVHSAGKRVGAMTSDLAHSAANYVKNGREYVIENPAKGVLIAAGVGAVVGSLITLSMSRK